MDSLELTCWVYGTDTEVTSLEISPTKTVSNLQNAIQSKTLGTLGLIDTASLELYLIPFPGDDVFESTLNEWKPGGKAYLNTRQRLSNVDLAGKLIIVYSPDLAAKPMKIFYCLRGESRNRAFPVMISSTETVGDLKEAIKNEKPVGFGHIDADRLDLYRVSDDIPDVDEAVRTVDFDKELPGQAPLTQYFSTPLPDGRIHIVVDASSKVVPQKRSLEEPNVPSPKRIELGRQRFLDDRISCAPSTGGDPTIFLRDQDDPDKAIYCGRPPKTAAIIPVTLLHSSFGQFISDCTTLEVKPEDEAFAMELSTTMSHVYSDEMKRTRAIRDVFMKNGLRFNDFNIDQHRTDGAILVDGTDHPCVISEFKNEVGDTGAEPFFQATLCYLEHTRLLPPNANLQPCILLLVFGPWIAFAGAVWNLRPTVQILSDALSIHYHPTDTWARERVARHLGAFRNVVQTLKEYYRNLSEAPNLPSDQLHLFPYPTSFTFLRDQSQHTFKYTSQPFPDKLLFFGKSSRDQSSICIKFVRQYSKEVHERCSDQGHAPALYGYEELPGGWRMVVMQQAPASTHQWLRAIKVTPKLVENIKTFVEKLHGDGYVHGDIRDANIMVSKNDETDFVLLDFDWSGRIEKVRYPVDLNITTIRRPPGAKGGAIIKAEHDIEMVKMMIRKDSATSSF